MLPHAGDGVYINILVNEGHELRQSALTPSDPVVARPLRHD
jgi:hypothetical protein